MSWGLNPISDIANVGRDIGSVFTGATGTPGLHLLTGSPKSGSSGGSSPNGWGAPAQPDLSKTSPVDYIQQYLSSYGNVNQTPQQVMDVVTQRDPAALSSPDKLKQALDKNAAYFGWTAPGATGTGAGGSGSVIDPLAVQMFFQNTIAPYLQQVAGNEKQTADQLRNQPLVKGLPASYAATVKQGEQTQAADMDMLQQATLAAGATQPQVTMINQMLGLAQKASLQDYYRQLAAGIGSGGAAPTWVNP